MGCEWMGNDEDDDDHHHVIYDGFGEQNDGGVDGWHWNG